MLSGIAMTVRSRHKWSGELPPQSTAGQWQDCHHALPNYTRRAVGSNVNKSERLPLHVR